MEQMKRLYFNFEKIEQDIKLENVYQDDEKYRYITGIASTEDINSAGFVVENQALLEAWADKKSIGKNVALYDKHHMPIGKAVACELVDGKVICTFQIPTSGNERFLSVYDLGIYTGLSIGGWSLDGEWIRNETGEDIYHVTKFDWTEVSATDIPSNENALMLEAILATKPKAADDKKDEEPKGDKENSDDDKPKKDVEEECKKKVEQEITEEDIKITLENIMETIRGKF